MRQIIVCAAILAGLSACGDRSDSIEGKWAWFDVANCVADQDTIEFDGDDFIHRRNGEVFLQGEDLSFREIDVGESTRISADYVVADREIALILERNGDDLLIFQGSTVNGATPAAVTQAIGRQLFRCS